MVDTLKKHLSEFGFLNSADIRVILGITKVQRIKKGAMVIMAGENDPNLYLVLSGFFRTYVLRPDGEERTVYLAGPGMAFGSTRTVFRSLQSTENVVALENSLALRWDFPKFKKACEENLNLQKLYSTMLERSFIEAVERLEFHSVMNSDQRYEYLLQNWPEIMEKVPLKHIASYIGITPVSLSRLRARLAKGNAQQNKSKN